MASAVHLLLIHVHAEGEQNGEVQATGVPVYVCMYLYIKRERDCSWKASCGFKLFSQLHDTSKLGSGSFPFWGRFSFSSVARTRGRGRPSP